MQNLHQPAPVAHSELAPARPIGSCLRAPRLEVNIDTGARRRRRQARRETQLTFRTHLSTDACRPKEALGRLSWRPSPSVSRYQITQLAPSPAGRPALLRPLHDGGGGSRQTISQADACNAAKLATCGRQRGRLARASF